MPVSSGNRSKIALSYGRIRSPQLFLLGCGISNEYDQPGRRRSILTNRNGAARGGLLSDPLTSIPHLELMLQRSRHNDLRFLELTCMPFGCFEIVAAQLPRTESGKAHRQRNSSLQKR